MSPLLIRPAYRTDKPESDHSADSATLLPALREIVDLGAQVCATIAWRLDVAWPEVLAAEMRELIAKGPFTLR
jgi:hypothetical protein